MAFKCQEDSFLKEFTSEVVCCEPATLDFLAPGATTPQSLRGFNVICEDTILFPEGGGQPCDYGLINGQPVRNVKRMGTQAVHFVESKDGFEVGSKVKQIVDWNRRFDHMQQHSGQHLITALFASEFNYGTTSWWLGSDTCNVELDSTHLMNQESLDKIEDKLNELIREGRQVTWELMDVEAALQKPDARAPRGLPKDHVGMARIVRIEGIESNMCCGTHVTNLTQLQCIKLLYAEKVRGLVYVHFLVGDRVLRRLGECFKREQQLNLALKGGPAQYFDLIDTLKNNQKTATKAFQKLLKDIALSEADKVDKISPRPKYYTLHRKDGIEPDFINTFLRSAPEKIFYFLTVSENTPNGKGQIVLRGDPILIRKFGPQFMELLDGKGNGRDTNFQGKFNKIDQIAQCESLLKEYFNDNTFINF